MNPLIGSWTLVDYSRFDDNQVEIKWQGSQVGTCRYQSDSRVSIEIKRTSKVPLLDEYNKSLLYIWYRGVFEIISHETILHKVHEASDPSRVGKILKRDYFIDKNILVLKANGLKGPVKLIWKKEE